MMHMIVVTVYDRFMEKMNGHLGSVNKEVVFSVVLQEKIQCTRIANPSSLGQQIVQSLRSIKS